MENSCIDTNLLTEVEEYRNILSLYDAAVIFLQNQKWCKSVIAGWHDQSYSFYDKLGVFLFEIEPVDTTVDQFIWVINGDLPTVYLDQSVKTGKDALEAYCELMEKWSGNVIQGKPIDDCYPVQAIPSIKNAEHLRSRILFLREEFLSESDE